MSRRVEGFMLAPQCSPVVKVGGWQVAQPDPWSRATQVPPQRVYSLVRCPDQIQGMSFIQSLPISFSLLGAFSTLVALPNCMVELATVGRV